MQILIYEDFQTLEREVSVKSKDKLTKKGLNNSCQPGFYLWSMICPPQFAWDSHKFHAKYYIGFLIIVRVHETLDPGNFVIVI